MTIYIKHYKRHHTTNKGTYCQSYDIPICDIYVGASERLNEEKWMPFSSGENCGECFSSKNMSFSTR